MKLPYPPLQRAALALALFAYALPAIVCAVPQAAPAATPAPKPAAKHAEKSGVETSVYGKLDDGTLIQAYTLRNASGASAKIITYGATLAELWVPDRTGKEGDVVLGFDSLQGYLSDHPHFGGIIGRFANRIAKGKFTLDGKEYSLALNNGPNTLHGGKIGFDRKVWTGEALKQLRGAAVRLSYTSPDGEEHFPGALSVTVIYTLTDDNSLKIDYTAKTSKPTPVNLTNHSYFNLSGGGNALDYKIYIDADRYTPVDATLIPTGELAAVKNTPYDFTQPASIGARIGEIKDVGGYDVNYVLNGKSGTLREAAKVEDPASGREMQVWTTEPGVQFYNAIGLDGSITGKRGTAYPKFGAVCLETQHFPDSVNQKNFPNVILRPGQVLHTQTIYKFTAK
jgi:aldose 1-epimerase